MQVGKELERNLHHTADTSCDGGWGTQIIISSGTQRSLYGERMVSRWVEGGWPFPFLRCGAGHFAEDTRRAGQPKQLRDYFFFNPWYQKEIARATGPWERTLKELKLLGPFSHAARERAAIATHRQANTQIYARRKRKVFGSVKSCEIL